MLSEQPGWKLAEEKEDKKMAVEKEKAQTHLISLQGFTLSAGGETTSHKSES